MAGWIAMAFRMKKRARTRYEGQIVNLDDQTRSGMKGRAVVAPLAIAQRMHYLLSKKYF